MDKETLSNYGWIVICTLVLAIMIALATPFGEYISGAVKSTTQGLFDVSKNAMDSAGINIEGQSFENGDDTDMGGDNSNTDNNLTEVGLRFGQDYIVKTDAMWEECVGYVYTFYEDGSAKVSYCDDADEIEAGFFRYTDTQILPTDSENTIYFNIINNGLGLELYDTEETGKMTLVLRSTIPTPETPVQFDKRYIGEDGVVVFYADGSAKITDLLETDGEYFPAFTLSYSGTRIYSEEYEIEWSVSADGKTVTIEDVTFVLCEIDHFIQFGQKYICTNSEDAEAIGQYVILYEDGSLAGSLNSTGNDRTEAGGLKYVVGYSEGVLMEIVCIRVEYNGKVTYWPLLAATDSEHIGVGDDAWTLESAIVPCATFTDGTTLTWDQLKSKYSGVTDTAIGDSALVNCTTLKSIILPDTVQTIGNSAFTNCSSLSQIYMPLEGITAIDANAFANCTALTAVSLPETATISDAIFIGCTSLTGVKLPSTLTTIPAFAFRGCTSLINIEIPDSVVIINSYAFSGCSSLCNLYYDGTTTQWASVTLDSNWKQGAYLTSVSCSDGSITLS